MAEFSDFEDEEGVEEPVLTDEERSEIDEEVSGSLFLLDVASFQKKQITLLKGHWQLSNAQVLAEYSKEKIMFLG